MTPRVDKPLSYYAYIQQELLRYGILWSKFHNMTYAFSEADVDYTLRAYDEILRLVKIRIESGDIDSNLIGQPMETVFRPTKF
jgi:glutamate-1-semialdehyde 2,1-aminomutase